MSALEPASLQAAETRTAAESWRGYRVFGPDGYVGTVAQCLAVLAGGPEVLEIRAGLFVGRTAFAPSATVVRVIPAERRLQLRHTPRAWMRIEPAPRAARVNQSSSSLSA